MFCKNCGKEISDDAKYCPYCGVEQSNIEPIKNVSVKEENTSIPPEKHKKKSHRLLFVMIIFGFCIFGFVKFMQYQQSRSLVGEDIVQGNHDGDMQLFKRSANLNDISVNTSASFESLGMKYTIIPLTDIEGFEITINYLNSDKIILHSLVKPLGNVKKNVQINFSVSLFDLGLTTSANIVYESYAVTGGTVSYFK